MAMLMYTGRDCKQAPATQIDYNLKFDQLIEYAKQIRNESADHNQNVTVDLNPILAAMNTQISVMENIKLNTSLTIVEIRNAYERQEAKLTLLVDKIHELSETFVSASRETYNAINGVADVNSRNEIDAINRLALAVAAPRVIKGIRKVRYDKKWATVAPTVITLAAGIVELTLVPGCYEYRVDRTHYECGEAAVVEWRSVDNAVVEEEEIVIELPAGAVFHLVYNSLTAIADPIFSTPAAEFFGEMPAMIVVADDPELQAAIDGAAPLISEATT
jgi:uncharacterized coiled-coil protein SlyX